MGEAGPLVRALSWLSACLLVLLAIQGRAHPGHASDAELDWSSDQALLEVSLALWPEHLEEAIGHRLAAEGSLQRIEHYLQRHFRLVGDSGMPGKLTLLGIEEEYQRTWLYFTVERPPGEDLMLEFTALQELYPGQVNRAKALWAGGANTLVFSAGSGPQALPSSRGEPSAESVF